MRWSPILNCLIHGEESVGVLHGDTAPKNPGAPPSPGFQDGNRLSSGAFPFDAEQAERAWKAFRKNLTMQACGPKCCVLVHF